MEEVRIGVKCRWEGWCQLVPQRELSGEAAEENREDHGQGTQNETREKWISKERDGYLRAICDNFLTLFYF